MKEVEVVGTIRYEEYVREHRARLERLARWYRATYGRKNAKRRKPRHPAEDRLIQRYLEWERRRRKA
jgi:hypothetical protein